MDQALATSKLSFLPFTTFLGEFLQQIQWEMEYFLLLHWTSSDAVQWKSFKPYPALCESRPTKCSPPRAYCSTLLAARRPNTFLDFRPRILLQFTLLTVIGSSGPTKVQTFRNSNCLLWLPQHLKEKCGPGISPPIQILRSFQSDLFTFKSGNHVRKKVNFTPSVQLVTSWSFDTIIRRNNEQGIISYHKL